MKRFVTRIILLLIPSLAHAFTGIRNPLNNDFNWLSGGPEIFPRFAVLLLTFLGVFFLGAVLYGGGLMLTSAGNEEKADTGKKIITWAVIGIAVVAGAYAILKYVIEAFDAGGAAFG